ncbi:head GIN domain-containing protein [Massilia niabensis]|uniref:Head GIN domain-containing protein n=1 Tax=Massilia niabensis TaxID=544910 RepID=A0ABW0L1E9_9BURK
MNKALSTRISTFSRRTLLAACIAAGAVTVAAHSVAAPWSFGGEQVQGSGRIVKQERQVGNFKGLSLSVPAQVELRIGNTEGVTIEADDNLLPLLETVVEDGTLEIRPARRNLNFRSKSIRIVVQARSIERLSVGGSGSIDADALRTPRLTVEIGGSGSVNLKGVESDALAVAIGGSGALKAGRGTVGKLTVSIGGSGDVDLGRVQSTSAKVSVAGSGEATAWVRNELSVSIAGSGDVNYYGDPKVSTSTVGSGDVRRIGASPQ